MELKGKALNVVDRAILLVGVPLGIVMIWFLAPLAMRDSTGDLLFFGGLTVFFATLSIFGVVAQFASVTISEDGLVWRYLGKEKRVAWSDVEEMKYPILVGRGGFTSYAFFRQRSGKTAFLPCGGGAMKDTLIKIQLDQIMAKTLANQTPDRTRLARPEISGSAPRA